MVTMQQLEELENKVVKALRLIDELRLENSKLEDENEILRGIAEEAKLAVEERDQEVSKVRKELKSINRELKDVRTNEDALEQKLMMLLSKLETMGSSKAVQKSIKSKVASTKKATKKKSKSDNLSNEDTQENYLMLNDNLGEIILEDDGDQDIIGTSDDEGFIVIDDK